MTAQHESHTELTAQIELMREEQVQLRQEVAHLRATQNTKRTLPRFLSRSGLVAAISLLSVLALGGVAFASIPGPSGAINGCYDKGGALYVIDSAATCPGKTTALTWNQTGVQGPQGIQGVQGPQGPQGPAGPTNPLFCPNCDFRTVALPAIATGAYFPNTNFMSANLTNASLALADLRDADLNFANLTNANLYQANLRYAIMDESTLVGTDLVLADLTGADLSRSDLTNADLSSSTGLTSSTVVLVTWSNTICPDATNSNNDGNTCLGHGIS